MGERNERKETISFKSNRQRVLSTGGDGPSASSCAFNEVNCPYGVRGLIQAEKIFTELEAMRHSRETGHSVSKKSLTKFFKSIASPTNLSVVGGWPGLFHSYFLNNNEVITPQVLDEYERLATSLLSNANFSTTTTLPNNTSLPTERELDSTSQAAQILSEKLPTLSSFLTYIRTHRVDPVNGIVGLLPPPNLMEKYCPELFKQHHREPHSSRTATSTRLPTPLASGSTSNFLGGSTRLPLSSTSSTSSASLTPAHLSSRQKIPNNNREWTRKVREWAEIADPQRLQDQVREMARELDATISKLQTGDMVIAPWGKGSIWKWSRVLEVLGGDFVLVTEDPWESDIPSDISALTSATTSGAPLPTAMPNYMKGYNVLRKREVVLLPDELKPLLLSTASAKRLVDSPGERFHRDFMRSITGVIVNHLAKKGISMDLLDKAVAKNVHLRHETSLLRMIDHLEAVIRNNTDVEKICSILEELLNSGLIELNAEGAHPLLSDTARSLANFSVRRAVPGKLAEYVTKSKRAIEDLRKERTAVLNGTRKSQLANWWLTAIQEKVNRFLEEQYGYDPCALPENYTEDRPKDIQPVQRNLDIVKRWLQPKNAEDLAAMQLFIKSVSTQVYDPLNEFVDNATFILREWVESLESGKEKEEREKEQEKDQDKEKEKEKDNDKEELSSPTPSLKSSLSPSSDLTIATMAELDLISAKLKALKGDEHSHIQQLRSLLEDCRYVLEMKAMEEVAEREWSEALSEGQAIKPHSISKVVPIFGLVISCFARLENELQTVTELWHKPTSPSSMSPPLSPPGDRRLYKDPKKLGVGGHRDIRSAVKFKEAHPRRKTEIIDPDAPPDLALESGDSDKKDSISLLDFFLRKGGHPGATIPSNFRRRQLNEDEEDDTSDLVNLMKRRTVMGESIIHALHSQLNAEELELLAASNILSPSLSPQESSIISSAVHSSSSVIISPRDKEDELSPRKKRDREKKEEKEREKEREREKEKTRNPSSPPSSSSFFVAGHTRQPSSSSAAATSSSSSFPSPFIPGHSRQPSTGAKGAPPPIDLTQIMHSREVLGSLRSAHLSREEEDEVLEVLKTQTNNPEEVVKKLEKTRGGIGLFKAILSTISSSAISSSSSSASSSSASSSSSSSSSSTTATQPSSSTSSSTAKPNRKETREEPATDLLNLMREPAITGQTRPAGVRTDETAPSDLDDEDYASRRLSRNITRRSRVLSL